MILSRDNIISLEDIKNSEVSVPEWGGSVLVRAMTGAERDAFEATNLKNPFKDLRARLTAASCIDEQGNLLFTVDDVEALTKKSAAALDRIFDVACRLSGFTKKDIEVLGNVSGPTL